MVDFDIDVIDRAQLPGAPGARPGGLPVADFFRAARRLAEEERVRLVDLTEFDPSLDVSRHQRADRGPLGLRNPRRLHDARRHERDRSPARRGLQAGDAPRRRDGERHLDLRRRQADGDHRHRGLGRLDGPAEPARLRQPGRLGASLDRGCRCISTSTSSTATRPRSPPSSPTASWRRSASSAAGTMIA